MDVLLQRHCARYIYVVPEGLRELMSDISREVLRSQPTNIYTFIADYLDALMITRENARVAAKLVQYITEASETILEFLRRTGMNRDEADRITTIIQHSFKEYMEQKHFHKEDEQEFIARIIEDAEITPKQAEEATVIIQHAFRNFKLRKEKEKELLTGIINWRVAARSAIKLYKRTGVSHEEASRAATLIKAAYKGYYTRRLMKRLVQETATELIEEEEEGEGEEDEDEKESRPKAVRINFGTVIPHVDFEEPVLINADESGSAIVAAKSVLEDIFTTVLPKSKEETLEIVKTARESAPKVAEISQDDKGFIKDIMEDIINAIGIDINEIVETASVQKPPSEEPAAEFKPADEEPETEPSTEVSEPPEVPPLVEIEDGEALEVLAEPSVIDSTPGETTTTEEITDYTTGTDTEYEETDREDTTEGTDIPPDD